MNFRGITAGLVIGFFLVEFQGVGAAQNSRSGKDAKKKENADASIELKATEITESLNNIIGTFKLQEMEIVGSQEKPQFNYIMRWKDPVPFPEETEAVSGNLIQPQYAPLDSEGYREMIDMTTEK